MRNPKAHSRSILVLYFIMSRSIFNILEITSVLVEKYCLACVVNGNFILFVYGCLQEGWSRV